MKRQNKKYSWHVKRIDAGGAVMRGVGSFGNRVRPGSAQEVGGADSLTGTRDEAWSDAVAAAITEVFSDLSRDTYLNHDRIEITIAIDNAEKKPSA